MEGFEVSSCKIIFEIGPTLHNEEAAIQLIGIAADAGADAVKVQILNSKNLVNDPNQMFTYGILGDQGEIITIEEPLQEILKRRELGKESWIRISEYARSLNLDFIVTVTDIEDLNWIKNIYFQGIKIASGDITYIPLIKKAAELGKQIHVDTGTATLEEIQNALDVIYESGNDDVVIHHCPPGYPAPDEKIFLKTVSFLREQFKVKIAFSDHSVGWHMDIAALALGANTLEKTLTLNRKTRSPEHIFSLEATDAKKFVSDVRAVERAINSGVRRVTTSDQHSIMPIRRSAFYATDISVGDTLTESQIKFQRPGSHLNSIQALNLIGRRLNKDVTSGEPISLDDFYD